MKVTKLIPAELQQKISQIMQNASERETDPATLLRSVYELEMEFVALGYSLPEPLILLEKDLGQELCAISQERLITCTAQPKNADEEW